MRRRMSFLSGTTVLVMMLTCTGASASLALEPSGADSTASVSNPLRVYLQSAAEHAEREDWGETIVALEHARSVAPGDAGLHLALREARRASRNRELNAAPDTPLLQGEPASLRPLRALTLISEWTWALLGLAILWGLVGIVVLRRHKPPRISRTTAQLAALLLALLLLLPLMGVVGAPLLRDTLRPALLVEIRPEPRVAPDEDAPHAPLPALYSGTVVRVLTDHGPWRQVLFANGQRAWVSAAGLRPLDPRQPPL